MARSERGTRRRIAIRRGPGRVVGALLIVAVLSTAVTAVISPSTVGDAVDRVAAWSTSLRDRADEVRDQQVDVRAAVGESRSVLVVMGSGADDAAFALFSADPDGAPAVTVVPQATLALVPGYGEFRIVDGLTFDGPELAAATLSNLLGIRIDTILALPPGSLATAILEPVGIDVPVALFIEDRGGISQLFERGPATLDGDELEALMITKGEGDEFEWLRRQTAGWEAVLAAIEADPGVADRLTARQLASPGRTADLLITVALDDDVRLGSLPLAAVDSGPTGSALVPADDIETFVLDRFAHLLLVAGPRPTVEVLNGNGRIGATIVVAEALIRAGFRVVRTDNADTFDHPVTLVIAQGSRNEDHARRARSTLGLGDLFLELRAPSSLVDVSIIVGNDIPAGED